MTLTVAYVRVSTEDQVDYSPEAQASRCRQYARQHDLGPVTVLADEGWSGKNLDRPQVQRLLELAVAEQVNHVIVWRVDRLTRDTGDLYQLVRLFEQHCVSLHSVNEGQIDLRRPRAGCRSACTASSPSSSGSRLSRTSAWAWSRPPARDDG